MRITADIIDEEISIDDSARNKITDDDDETLNVEDNAGAFISPSAYIESTAHVSNHESYTSKQQQERIADMCNKFKNLNVSENTSCMTDDVLKIQECYVKALHSKDKMDEKKNIESNAKQETPPPWIWLVFTQMKQEIKKEILEELSKSPQGQSASGEKVDDEVVHPGIYCDNCDQLIRGIRYKCGNCTDFDLCQECESLPNIHDKSHIFLKIRYPVSFKFYEKQKLSSLFVTNSSDLFNQPATLASVRSHTSAKRLFEVKFIQDETVPDGTVIPASTTFVKSWRIMNNGKRAWTQSTRLQRVLGLPGLNSNCKHVDVPKLKPGEQGIVSVLFETPAVPGSYRSDWRFCHKNRAFGDTVWCKVVVCEKRPMYAEKITEFRPMFGETISESILLPQSGPSSEKDQEVASSIVEVLTAVKEEHRRGNMIPRKLAVTSHTATPNNTPFDLTPPKSPDHHVPVIELKDVAEDKETTDSRESLDENDDEASVVSLSSSESDAEFVVIPMPKCFNLSDSIASRKIPYFAEYFQPENVADKDSKSSEHKSVKLQSVAVKPSFSSETVSQETGVPELSEPREAPKELTVTETAEQKIFISHNVSGDGSSSEISIIDSGENSPTGVTLTPDIGEIHIAVTEEIKPKNDGTTATEDKGISVQIESSEEQLTNIPCSATFPKFPIEGITSVYESASSSCPERTVQVLPEGLMYAPLNATAALYKSAKKVLSNIQNQRNAYVNGVILRDDIGTSDASSLPLNAMEQLSEMGFCNRQQNEELLKKHKNDVALVVAELVSLNDNDWYASRHVPASPPDD